MRENGREDSKGKIKLVFLMFAADIGKIGKIALAIMLVNITGVQRWLYLDLARIEG